MGGGRAGAGKSKVKYSNINPKVNEYRGSYLNIKCLSGMTNDRNLEPDRESSGTEIHGEWKHKQAAYQVTS